MKSIPATPSLLRLGKLVHASSAFNVVIRFSFAPNRQDFQFAHLNYKHFIDSMNQSGQIYKTVPSEAKKLDAQRTKSRQNEMRQS